MSSITMSSLFEKPKRVDSSSEDSLAAALARIEGMLGSEFVPFDARTAKDLKTVAELAPFAESIRLMMEERKAVRILREKYYKIVIAASVLIGAFVAMGDKLRAGLGVLAKWIME